MAVRTRDARFQQWQALLTNRTKRTRSGRFLVQGVRPITIAVRHRWPVEAVLRPAGRRLSSWAADTVASSDAEVVEVAPDLLAELGEKGDGPPELVAVARLGADDLARVPAGPGLLAVVFDRPTSPGNVGTLVRSADAFGASGVVVTGHAADPYDPRAVRASTGSVFAVPVVRCEQRDVVAWVHRLRTGGLPVRLLGTDETGAADVDATDLTGPTVLVVGNETTGLSAAWRDACDAMLRIPIGGAASSLNAATAGSLVLYEAARQRRSPTA
ncbi:TrmH family RNA methyltransferase [Actinocatenispora rupis]|uniref:rRNA methyltransferase n=1 Tax=Actinocatenispora rupis TaxID=519421 RepID=A0A8J3IVW8_9ACTN|nr:TrmH family RNA methyltransferase [Actinocatenispora rupis]GID09570.1 rRNA methyltransferase [Actinocatenispora rupis]